MSEHIEAMLSAAHDNQPVQFAAAFDAAVKERTHEKIEAMRPVVAASLFGGEAGKE